MTNLASLTREPAKLTADAPAHKRDQSSQRSVSKHWKSLALRDAGVHAKLAISQPADPAEQEADRIADRVLRMTNEPRLDEAQRVSTSSYSLQRKCAECEEEDEENKLQRKADHHDGGHRAPAKQELFDGAGEPLDTTARKFFEPRFGQSLDDVRIHRNAAADASARSIDALAFTLGRHVAFRGGEYAPQTTTGRKLLAHELAHVAQQGGMDRIHRYRDVTKADKPVKNWGAIDDSKKGLIEKSRPDPGDPVIETINIKFTGNDADKLNPGELLVTGRLVAKYRASDKRPDIDIPVTGGTSAARPFGLTDRLTGATVHRIQGPGYNDQPLKASAGVQPAAAGETSSHYVKQTGTVGHAAFDFPSSMGLAVYFQGTQAMHLGDKTFGSHACIHVDWNAQKDEMRLINYHSLIKFTKVTVEYDKNAAFKAVCCSASRLKRGFVNPCDVFSKADCAPPASAKP